MNSNYWGSRFLLLLLFVLTTSSLCAMEEERSGINRDSKGKGSDCSRNTENAEVLAAKAASANVAEHGAYGSMMSDDDEASSTEGFDGSIAPRTTVKTVPSKESRASAFCSWLTDCLWPKKPEQEGETTRLLSRSPDEICGLEVSSRSNRVDSPNVAMSQDSLLELPCEKGEALDKNQASSLKSSPQSLPLSPASSLGSMPKNASYNSIADVAIEYDNNNRHLLAQEVVPSDTTKGIFNPGKNDFVNSSLLAFKALASVFGMHEIDNKSPQLAHFLQADVLTRAECTALHLEMRGLLQKNKLNPALAGAIDEEGVASEQQDASEFLKILLARVGVPGIYFQEQRRLTNGKVELTRKTFIEPFVKLEIKEDASGDARSMQSIITSFGEKLLLKKTPGYFFVQLARYPNEGDCPLGSLAVPGKLDHSVEGVMECIRVRMLTESNRIVSVQCEPIAFICHHQEAIFNEGHYSTFLKEDGENGQWKRYNDNQIDDLDTLSKEDMDAISRDCYLILYKEIIQS